MTYELMNAHENERALSWLSQYWERPTGLEYFCARSLNEAISLAEEYGQDGKIIAGGTDLLGLIKNRVSSPRVLIDIKNLPDLKQIDSNHEGVSIGSLALINDIERSPLIAAKYPLLQVAAHSIGSPQIRNMATLAGSLLQDVRCWYYRRSPATGNYFKCRRKIKTGRCYATSGANQYHAVIGGCDCSGVCPSDMATSLLALDARVKTINTKGGRTLSIDELYAPLGNTLERDEIITSVQIPVISPRTKQRFLKFRVRNAIDFAIVSVAAAITLQGDAVKDISLVLGGVSYRPYRAVRSEGLLKRQRITEALATEAGKAAVSEMVPLSKNGYKVPILEALIKRALLE